MNIRKPVEEEFTSVWDLMNGMRKANNDEMAARQRFSEILNDDAHHLVIAEQDGEFLGYAWVQDYGYHMRTGNKEVYFRDLYVESACRQQGIGRALFEEVKRWAKERNASWLQWHSSKGAVAFYQRLGLQPLPPEEAMNLPMYEIEF